MANKLRRGVQYWGCDIATWMGLYIERDRIAEHLEG